MKTYKIIKQAISKELADFTYQYFLLKRSVARKYFDERYINGNIITKIKTFNGKRNRFKT